MRDNILADLEIAARRTHLNDFQAAVRDIEYAQACIRMLERMTGQAPQRIIKTLKREQQRYLKQIDASAAKLGAPYGAER